MDLNLAGYNVVVTGSSKGIGKAIAKSFIDEGANVALTGRDIHALTEAKDELIQLKKGHVLDFAGDLINLETLQQFKSKLKQQWSVIDTLVCNIGSGRAPVNFTETTEDWQKQFDINLFSAVNAIKVLWELLVEGSANKNQPFKKSIICISSICGYENLDVPVPIPYAAAKAALNSFVKNVMKPCAKAGIRINVVSPGNILFPGSGWERRVKETPELVDQMLRTEVPLECLGAPEDIASVVTFLASEKARFVTGANWVVDGGQTRS